MSDKKIAPAFVPASQVEQLIYDGNVQGTLDYLHTIEASGRSGHRTALRRIGKLMNDIGMWSDPSACAWRARPTHEQRRAFNLFSFVCGGQEERIESCRVYRGEEGDLVAMWRAFPPEDPDALADAMLASSAIHFGGVQSLYCAGVIARPAHDNYVLGLLDLPMDRASVMTVRDCIERDPGLIQDTLLKLFDIEGTSDNSLSGKDKYGAIKSRSSWSGLFLDLCAAGHYSRAQLIEKTLDALERDWIQFRSGWFSRFHEALAPDAQEMAPFAIRYLGLCHSRIAPTVTLAVTALGHLFDGGYVSGASLVQALHPVLASSVKQQVAASLKLVDQAVAREPAFKPDAGRAILAAFSHPAPDIHLKLIARLRTWGMDEATRQEAAAILPHVAAVHRDAMAALLDGGAPAAAAPQRASPALPVVRPPLPPLHESRLVTPIADADDLVERTAYVFEHSADIDELERVFDGLLRQLPAEPEPKRRFGAMLKRARALAVSSDHWSDDVKPAVRALCGLVIFMCEGEQLAPATSYAQGDHSAYALLSERIDGLIHLARQGQAVSPLATPTHRRGFIAPGALVERIAHHMQLGISSPTHEQVLSLLRLAPGTDAAILARAQALPDKPYTRALRYALGDTSVECANDALFSAAARVRHPDGDDPQLAAMESDPVPDGALCARYSFSVQTLEGESFTHHYGEITTVPVPRRVAPDFIAVVRHPLLPEEKWHSHIRFGGRAESTVALSATILPSSLEGFFAEAVRSLSNNLDWSGAEWQNKAYLAPLLDPTVPFTPLAYYVLALGLGGKEPGQTALSVDALICAWTEGRMVPGSLADILRSLMQTPLVKLARYAKSLSSAARAHALGPQLVFGLLCETLRFDSAAAPRDTATLLELLLELALELGQALPVPTRNAIGAFKLTGKGKTAQQALLSRC